MIQGSDFKKHCEAAGMLIEALPNLFDEVCSYQGQGGVGEGGEGDRIIWAAVTLICRAGWAGLWCCPSS